MLSGSLIIEETKIIFKLNFSSQLLIIGQQMLSLKNE